MTTEGEHEIQGGLFKEVFEVCSHANKNQLVTRKVLMMQDRERIKQKLSKEVGRGPG